MKQLKFLNEFTFFLTKNTDEAINNLKNLAKNMGNRKLRLRKIVT